ncbi:DUF2079 domain-containing protein [Kitasatospora cystarginea]|uniref:DUF2079 domain-containing protein n=1 Tax=Kitasatospora cystarginea TaxID=58350 RepID=A0ABN3DN13_9ACTN
MQAPPTDGITSLPQQTTREQRPAPDPSAESRTQLTWWIWALAVALFFVYMLLSLRIHQRILSNSYDLGVFEQAVRSYAEGHLPVSELKAPGFPVLGDHFSPVLALLAPLYRLWPSAMALLVAQAALVASSVLPLTCWARRTLGSPAAAVIGVCYGLSWGLASGVGYDFHEVAFAVPLLACSLSALGSGRLRAAVWWALPLLLVKEDLGVTVAVIGVLVARRGGGRLGFGTVMAGLTGTVLGLAVLSALSPDGVMAHWFLPDGSGGGRGGPAGLLFQGTIGMITPDTKVMTLLLVLAPTLFLALRSSLLWTAVPTLLWRFASGLSPHWGTGFHYSLVLMPIVFAAFVDALNLRSSHPASVRRYLAGSAAITCLLLPQFPFWQLVQSATWRSDPRVAVAHSLMNRIPDGATVQASTFLVPQLTNRTSVSLFGWAASRPDPQWIMVDTRMPMNKRWPLSIPDEQAALGRALSHGYRTVAAEDGFVLLNRPG